MAKRTKVMSLSVKPEHHELIKDRAAQLNTTLSEIGRRIIEDFVEISPEIHHKIKAIAEARRTTVASLIEENVSFFEIEPEIRQKLDSAVKTKTAEKAMDFADVSEENHKKLLIAAEKRAITIGQTINQLVDRFPISDDSVKPIILKIPLTILGNKEKLSKWLHDKADVLVAHLYS